jgi:hypothetical protein
MHLKVFLKLKKNLKTPIWEKIKKKPNNSKKKPKLLGWFFFKPGFFPTLPAWGRGGCGCPLLPRAADSLCLAFPGRRGPCAVGKHACDAIIINVSVVYNAREVMILIRALSITRAIRRGGP